MNVMWLMNGFSLFIDGSLQMYGFRFSLHANVELVAVRFPNSPEQKTRFSCTDQYHDYRWYPMDLLKLSAHHSLLRSVDN